MFRLMFEFSRLDAQNPEQVSKTLLWVFPAKVYKRGDNHSFKRSPTAGVLILLVFRKMEWTRDIVFRLIELYRAIVIVIAIVIDSCYSAKSNLIQALSALCTTKSMTAQKLRNYKKKFKYVS